MTCRILTLGLLALVSASGRAAVEGAGAVPAPAANRPADAPGSRYAVTGLVLSVDSAARTLTVSCREVPGALPPMVRTLAVREPSVPPGLRPGVTVELTVVNAGGTAYADDVRVRPYENLEQEPSQLRRLRFLDRLVNPAWRAEAVALDERVPDFTLIDQEGRPFALSALAGKVVALTFTYFRCPNPAYCFTLASNFGQLQKRFAPRLGGDLVLLTVVLDPEHDRDAALADYASVWTANPRGWRFLTGAPADLRGVLRRFGVDGWKDEGLVIHSFNTAVIDRRGVLVANLEGNQFTARQLGDLVQSFLDTR